MKAHAWVFAVSVAAPIVLAFLDGTTDPSTLWSNLAVMTGSQAVITLLFSIVAASRMKFVTGKYGIDGAIGIHAALASATVALAALHLAAVIADNPANVWLIDATGAPNRALAGTAAFLGLAAMLAFAERRGRVYERWQWAHRGVGITCVILIGLHIWWLDRLIETWPWLILFTAVSVSTFLVLWWRWWRTRMRGKFMVSETWQETPSVTTVALRPCGDPMEFDPGQFMWLRLGRSPWAQDHPFTISSPADERGVEFTFRHAGDWTTGPLQKLRPGTPVWVDGPHGAMTLGAAEGAPGIVAVAAGVGLTPVMSILRTMAWRDDQRPVVVVVPPAEPVFRDDLAWLAEHINLTVVESLVRPVTAETLAAALPDRAWVVRAAYYASGPPSLVSDAYAALRGMGVDEGQIHTEQFQIA